MRVCLCACEDSTDSRNLASVRCLYMARYDTQELCHRKGAATCLRRPSARPSSHGVHSCVMALQQVSDLWESAVYLQPAAERTALEHLPSSRMICPQPVTPAIPESCRIWSQLSSSSTEESRSNRSSISMPLRPTLPRPPRTPKK